MSEAREAVVSGRQSRRQFLVTSSIFAGAVLMPRLMAEAAAAPTARFRIGSCMIDLDQAKRAGLEGVEISVGVAADQLRIADPAVRQEYKDKMKETGLVISSFMMGLLNSNPLVSDPRAPAWLSQSIDAAKDLGAKVILVAFFSKGDLREGGQLKKADVDAAVERIKAAAPRAKAAGVILALENTLSAEQNAEILQRIGSDAVRIYYDVGNSTSNGYDVPAEIRFLRERIAQFHFKDFKDSSGEGKVQSYLGEGKVPFPPIAAAIREIGYQGWIVMETSSPSKDRVADAQRNATYIRRLFGMAP
jgi:sugar phosphate isomerase/epimerase